MLEKADENMAETSTVRNSNSNEDYVNLQDVLYSFNNSISEEQAWAVCHQCAQYLLLSQNSQDRYRDIYYYGITAIQLSPEGEVKIEMNFNQGSGKGPPSKLNFVLFLFRSGEPTIEFWFESFFFYFFFPNGF